MYQVPNVPASKTAKFPAFFQKFINTICDLRINKVKVTSGNAFIVDDSALGGNKISKYDESNLFSSPLRIVDLSLNT